jgi:tyrosine-protein kinase Etk/Wzc
LPKFLEMQEKNKIDQGAQDLFVFIWKKRKPLMIVGAVAFVASIVASLLMTELFRSTAIVFPAATSTVSFSEQRNAKAGAMDFGEEEQSEQLLQILQSSRIRNRIVEKFDLYNYFEIEADDKNRNFKLHKKYEKHITFERTRYGSIVIDVLDKDPNHAAEMANYIVKLIDTVKNEMVKERTVPAFEIISRKYHQLETEKLQLEDTLMKLSVMGVVTKESRANLYTSLSQVKTAADHDYIKKAIEVNAMYGALYDGLAELREFKTDKLTTLEAAYEQAESDANADFTHKFDVEIAVPADKKAKPNRLIVVLVSTLGALAAAILFFLVQAKIAELREIA